MSQQRGVTQRPSRPRFDSNRGLLLVGACLALAFGGMAPGPLAWGAVPALCPYDNFDGFPNSGPLIDSTRWQHLETVREIRAGKLVHTFRAAGPPGGTHDTIGIVNPTTVQSLQASVRLNAFAHPLGGASRVGLRGSYYNDGTGGPGNAGDVWARLRYAATETGVGIEYSVFRCDNADCSITTDIKSPPPVKAVGVEETHTLGIAWNGSVFTFRVDDDNYVVDPKLVVPIPPINATPSIPLRALEAGIRRAGAGGEGYASGDFDDILVNGALYDDFDGAPFSGPRLDPAKWTQLEFVRDVEAGSLALKSAAHGAIGTEVGSTEHFINQKSVSTIRADVTVSAFDSSQSVVTARLDGYFYNDGSSTGRTDYTGDIQARLVIYSREGSALRAALWIDRCANPGCTLSDSFGGGDLGPVDIGTRHTMLLSWDGSVFTYGMDANTRTYDPKPHPPEKPALQLSRHLRSKVEITQDSGYGYLAATFDNVYVNCDALNLPKLAPSLRETLAGDVVSAGVGLRGTGTGTINLTTIPPGATVKKAYLYWATLGSSGTFTTPTLNSVGVSGTRIGQSNDPDWGVAQAFTYRADVTSRITGNGAYTIANLPHGPTPPEDLDDNDSEGASLVVVYSMPGAPARTILINEGGFTLSGGRPPYYATPFTGFTATSPPTGAKLTFVVGDGQSLTPEYAGLNTTLLSTNAFSGSDGPYWDTRTYDVSSAMAGGATSATAKVSTANDSLVWVAAILSVPVILPTVTVTASDGSATEAGLTPGTFTFSRTGNTAAALTVSYTVTGTATAGLDYASLGSSVTIPAGAANITKTVTPVQDALQEQNETVVLTLSQSTLYAVGTPNSATVTLTSDEVVTQTVTVRATDSTATEAGLTPGTFTFSRTGTAAALAAALTVSYSVSGTATPGTDYASLGSSVSFASNVTSVTKTVTPLQDALQEFDETVSVTLTQSPTYAVGSPSSATVTIVSDEPRTQTVTVRATDPNATEAGLTPGTFTFSRTGTVAALAAALTVSYSVSGTATPGLDYGSLGSSVSFAPGVTSVTKTVTPLQDTLQELNETVVVTLSQSSLYAVGTPSTATVTLTSDEAVTRIVTVTASDPIATEAGLTTGTFTFTRTGSLTTPLTVSYTVGGTATAGVDYVSLGTSVTFLAGQSTIMKTVTPRQDSLQELNETVILTLVQSPAYAVGTFSTAAVAIVSDEPITQVVTITALDPSAGESPANPGSFRITRTGSLVAPLTVTYTRSGTATAGLDYLNNFSATSVTIPAGQGSVTLPVTPINDSLKEAPETVTLTLGQSATYAVGSPSSATVTIVSDERP